MDSIWTEGVMLPRFEQLQGECRTDVLIIGGGITGILCARFLQKKGIDYMLVEGGRICGGITQTTTAKLTFQHGLIYDRLVRKAGPERAKLYLEANKRALQTYMDLCEGIDCDLEIKPSYVYSLHNRQKLEKEAQALDKIGFSADITETEGLPFATAGAIRFRRQAQFHPLKFLAAIAKDLNIYENSFVKELAEKTAVTEKGKITFQKLIVSTHFPVNNKHGMYFLKMYQHRSYVTALHKAPLVDGMYVDEAKGGLSFRSYRDCLLVGGGSHRTGKGGGGWQELREFAAKYYPAAVEKYHWAAQDCMTLDGIPYIGKYSRTMTECYVATGFNKWGMTSSMVAAMILADLAVGQANPYAELFSPSRSMWKPQLFVNVGEAALNLLSPTKKRCPHLGCALKWNEAEHSWDCPCHGSRFDDRGRLLDNPANGDLKG